MLDEKFTTTVVSEGVTEVHLGDIQVGLITWAPNPVSGIISAWYATYANGDETVRCGSEEDALNHLQLQHAVVRRLARSIRSMRPAPGLNGNWDLGYNQALRDVERLLQEVVGRAPQGEGYTAITRPTN
jgi:hypothetical protein